MTVFGAREVMKQEELSFCNDSLWKEHTSDMLIGGNRSYQANEYKQPWNESVDPP